MKVGYDPAKSAKTLRKRGLTFDMVYDLEWNKAMTFSDDRKNYGEKRMIAFVPLGSRLYVVCYTMRETTRWIISFRKANKREAKKYEEKTAER